MRAAHVAWPLDGRGEGHVGKLGNMFRSRRGANMMLGASKRTAFTCLHGRTCGGLRAQMLILW